MNVLGVDIGGTNIRIGLFTEDLKLIEKNQELTSKFLSEAEALQYIADTGLTLIERSEVPLVGAGIGAPGPLDPFSGMLLNPPNLPGWGEVSLKEVLSEAWGLPVHVHNDANAAAVASHYLTKDNNLVYMTISTGVGTGVICDGKLILGRDGNAAEFGHIIIRPTGILCSCGNTGCIEAQISGTGIVKRMKQKFSKPSENWTTAQIFRSAAAGEKIAVELIKEVQEDLAIAIQNVVLAYNPSQVIFGGGVMQAGEHFLKPAINIAKERIFPGMQKDLHFSISELGGEIGLYGAAALVLYFQQYEQHTNMIFYNNSQS